VGIEPHITDFYSSTLSRAVDFRLVNPDCTGRLQSPIYCDKPAFIDFRLQRYIIILNLQNIIRIYFCALTSFNKSSFRQHIIHL
jgi:hypothetical protein